MARPRKHTDAQLLAIAREVFLEQGAGAPMSAIAARAGLSQPALSSRFGSKRALLLRALAPPEPAFVARLLAGPDDRPMRDQLYALSVEAAQFFADALPAFAALRAAGIDLAEEARGPEAPHAQVRALAVRYFERACDRGLIRDVDPALAASTLIGALQAPALASYALGAPLPDPEPIARGVVDLLWSGLAPDPSAPPAGA